LRSDDVSEHSIVIPLARVTAVSLGRQRVRIGRDAGCVVGGRGAALPNYSKEKPLPCPGRTADSMRAGGTPDAPRGHDARDNESGTDVRRC
jgi:hypothetical protein